MPSSLAVDVGAGSTFSSRQPVSITWAVLCNPGEVTVDKEDRSNSSSVCFFTSIFSGSVFSLTISPAF